MHFNGRVYNNFGNLILVHAQVLTQTRQGRIGIRILRALPRSAAHKLLLRQPTVLRVWCDRELSQPGEGHKENDQNPESLSAQNL